MTEMQKQCECYIKLKWLLEQAPNETFIKGDIWCDFKFSSLFGMLLAVCAQKRSLKLEKRKSQDQIDILYKS